MNKKLIAIGGTCLIIGVIIGYFSARAISPRRNFTGMNGGSQRNISLNRQAANGERFATGTIDNIYNDQMVIKTLDGSSQIIMVTNSTTFKRLSDAAKEDFTNGTRIMVNGKTNPDGSITATAIQTAPENQFRGQRPN